MLFAVSCQLKFGDAVFLSKMDMLPISRNSSHHKLVQVNENVQVSKHICYCIDSSVLIGDVFFK